MQPPTHRPSRSRTVLVAAILLVVALVVLLVWAWQPLTEWWRPAPAEGTPLAVEDPGRLDGPVGPENGPPTPADPELAGTGAVAAGEGGAGWTNLPGVALDWPADALAPTDCAAVRREVSQLCRAVERRPGLDGTCTLLRAAVQDLARRPPDPAAGLGDPQSLVAGAVHLFRVLGRDRVNRLRRLLDDHPELAEPLALVGSRWAASRQACGAEGDVPAFEAAAYDYAAYLFTSLGGQAYLHRRSPRVEALACFWGLAALERARAGGHDPLGVDPRSAIERCIELVRGTDLRFRKRYLEELARLQEDWRRRAGGMN